MFGKTKRYAALFAVGLTMSSCGGLQEGSLLDPVFWEQSNFSKAGNGSAATDRGLAELVKGNYLPAEALFDEALEAVQHIADNQPDSDLASMGFGQVYLAMGELEQSREHMELAALDGYSAIELANRCSLYVAQGQREEALECLEQLLDDGYRDFAGMAASPYLASLQDDPEYQALVASYQTGQSNP